ncbi:MAG: hypothetical protein AVDCRST_MAG51-190 [uncultured Ramlibacter sp.]|uniref:DUF5666 domain-containing protein n=1 Tax=uncultured Ramlibacter sp. TaxID=260755 RepID=A0A6J4NG77_9BURK|nr:MAG: hypothetical protein AVDCRST_MAG51-190 [uncultured Ramlibacter sp.]
MKRRELHRLALAAAAALGLPGCGGGGSVVGAIGSGGTGITGGDGIGSGGTGVQVTPAGVGTVDGFGSIIVNGTRFDTDSARFAVADVPDLKLGMTVQVQGSISADLRTGVASVVTSAVDLRGRVEELDVATGTFRVWSSRVYTDGFTVLGEGLAGLADLRDGDWVQIHGLAGKAAKLRATRIERPAARGTPILTAAVESLQRAAGTFSMGGFPVRFSEAALAGVLPADGLVDGLLVRVRGTETAGGLVANSIEAWYPVEPVEGEPLTLGGLVTRIGGLADLLVDGVPVDASSARITGGTAADLAPGTRVEVAGTTRNGVLVASRLKLRQIVSTPGAAPAPAPAPASSPSPAPAPSPSPAPTPAPTPAPATGSPAPSPSPSPSPAPAPAPGQGQGRDDDDDRPVLSAEGTVSGFRAPARFRIRGEEIDAGRSSVVFVNGSRADLANGRKVRVTGSTVTNDVLVAERVEFLR